MVKTKLAACVVAGVLMSVSAQAQDCSSVGNNPINDSMVAALQQQAAAAEERASMARNPGERERWEDAANSLQMQAQAAQDRAQAVAEAAQTACQALSNQNQGSN